MADEPIAWVMTSSAIVRVKAQRVIPANARPQVHELKTPEVQSIPKGTFPVRVPLTVLSGTITIKYVSLLAPLLRFCIY